MSAKKKNGEAIRLIDSYLGPAYNPDVLSCLANLSNDEVFTPPEVVNDMLDMLPQELFEDPDVTFLDPVCKSGVFLREIAKRLVKGLAKKIPDLHERVENIFMRQLFGIAITELTSLMSRRSLYCSKYSNGKFSIVPFESSDGNIRFKNVQHTWINGRCKYCGVAEAEFGDETRGNKEKFAYEFIHFDSMERLFNMKFDVIIGNPPYQMVTSGSIQSQATPLYQKFIEKAKDLNPRYLTMIIPSRWMNGGFGLDAFRKEMLSDKNIRILHDFLNAKECFPGIALTGGVCYFLRDRDHKGQCEVYTHRENGKVSVSKRFLLEEGLSTFIRYNEALSILNKVLHSGDFISFSKIVSQRDPFGLNYYEDGKEKMFKLFTPQKVKDTDLPIYYFGWQKNGIAYANPRYIQTNSGSVGKYKVFISKANGAASLEAPFQVLSKPFVGGPGTICNMTYLLIGPFDTKNEADNVAQFISTKFVRYLVNLLKNTQNALKKVYEFVPLLDFKHKWSDEDLYQKYNLSNDEINIIEDLIRPMEL